MWAPGQFERFSNAHEISSVVGGWDVKRLRWHLRVMAKHVGPGLAKPECPFGLKARDENEARVSGIHRGPQ